MNSKDSERLSYGCLLLGKSLYKKKIIIKNNKKNQTKQNKTQHFLFIII